MKVNGNYLQARSGITENALRFLTGLPILSWDIGGPEQAWGSVLNSLNHENPIVANIEKEDHGCGLTLSHSYAILAAFELKNEDGTPAHRLIMIRNPRNFDPRSKNGKRNKWDNKDTENWTKHFIKQVPFGYDPLTKFETGVFFVEPELFSQCFDTINVAISKEPLGYKYETWYDIENDQNGEKFNRFQIKMPSNYTKEKNEESMIYVEISSYVDLMVPV